MGWITPVRPSHCVEQFFRNVLQLLESKVAPERLALGVREFHSVGGSKVVRWRQRWWWLLGSKALSLKTKTWFPLKTSVWDTPVGSQSGKGKWNCYRSALSCYTRFAPVIRCARPDRGILPSSLPRVAACSCTRFSTTTSTSIPVPALAVVVLLPPQSSGCSLLLC